VALCFYAAFIVFHKSMHTFCQALEADCGLHFSHILQVSKRKTVPFPSLRLIQT